MNDEHLTKFEIEELRSLMQAVFGRGKNCPKFKLPKKQDDTLEVGEILVRAETKELEGVNDIRSINYQRKEMRRAFKLAVVRYHAGTREDPPDIEVNELDDEFRTLWQTAKKLVELIAGERIANCSEDLYERAEYEDRITEQIIES